MSFAERPTPIWEIPFPAVTICPEIKATKTFVYYDKNSNIFTRNNNTSNVKEVKISLGWLMQLH